MNREKTRKSSKKFFDNNKEKVNLWNRISHDKNRFGNNKQAVLERDNFKCVSCGMTAESHLAIFNKSITVDHIDGRGRRHTDPNHNIDNLQTLCLRCHGKKDGGRRLK